MKDFFDSPLVQNLLEGELPAFVIDDMSMIKLALYLGIMLLIVLFVYFILKSFVS